MTNESVLQSLVGRSVRVTRREYDWTFDFGDNHVLTVGCLWRLRNLRILLTGEDDGHKFGLPTPVDAEEQANALLSCFKVATCSVDSTSSDIKMEFSNEVTLEVIANSSGYEGWQAALAGALIIGRGDGLTEFEGGA